MAYLLNFPSFRACAVRVLMIIISLLPLSAVILFGDLTDRFSYLDDSHLCKISVWWMRFQSFSKLAAVHAILLISTVHVHLNRAVEKINRIVVKSTNF